MNTLEEVLRAYSASAAREGGGKEFLVLLALVGLNNALNSIGAAEESGAGGLDLLPAALQGLGKGSGNDLLSSLTKDPQALLRLVSSLRADSGQKTGSTGTTREIKKALREDDQAGGNNHKS